MSKLLAYSGLTTKVRAMEKNLLKEAEYEQIMGFHSVTDVVTFLEKQPGYRDVFNGVDIYALHRGDLEKYLLASSYRDFAKLYNFASVSQRKYLELYFMQFETHLLKQVLRGILNKHSVSFELSIIKPYFDKFSKIDLTLLAEAKSIDDYIASLKSTIYYGPMLIVHNMADVSLYDYELCLDLQYFEIMWNNRSKFLSGTDYKVVTMSYGYMIDLLNLQWIYRCKKYYKIANADVYSMLIPINYKLKKSQLHDMAVAENLNTLMEIFHQTYYYKKSKGFELEEESFETLYKILLDKHHTASFKTNPYSLACIDTYLYQKQQEISKLISLIECIRYSYPTDKIHNLLNNGGEQFD